MATAAVASRATGPEPGNPGRRRRPGRSEAVAAVRTLVEWPGDDPATRREFLSMIGSHRSASHER